MSECIDLTALCGKKYRVTYEESYYAQYGPRAITNDPWLKIIPCQNGHVFPWGGNRLAASTNRLGPVAGVLCKMEGVELWNDASEGVTVLFDVSLLEGVLEIMKPKRRKQVSDAERQRLTAMGFKVRQQPHVESPETVQICDPTT